MENKDNKDFKQIFSEYLNAYANGGMQAVKELVAKNNLSTNALKELEKANDLIDRIDLNKQMRIDSLKTREEWEEVVLGKIIKKHNVQ